MALGDPPPPIILCITHPRASFIGRPRVHLCPVHRYLLPCLIAVLLLACRSDPQEVSSEPTTDLELRLRAEREEAKALLQMGLSDSAETMLRRMYARTEGDPDLVKQRIFALSMLGRIQQRRSLIDSALATYKEGLLLAEQIEDTGAMGTMWLNVGAALEDKADYEAALAAQLTALRWKELEGDERSTARVLHNLSILYWRQDSTVQALRLLERSLALKRQHDPRDLATGLNGMGVLLLEMGRPDSALAVLKESLAFEDSTNGGSDRQIQISNIGLVFEHMGELDSAVTYYTQSLMEAREKNDPSVLIRSLYGLGDVRRAQGRYAESLPLLDSSLALATRMGSLEDMKEAHHSLVLLHERMGHAPAALEHFRAYHDLSDSLMNTTTGAAMEELRLRYDTEKKDRENEELRATAELTALRAERNRWIAMGIGLLALGVAAVSWTVVQRNRQRALQREAELEQQALRLQMDPHFLFNALNTVPGLYASGDTLAANDHVGHLSKFLRLVLETSRRRTIPLEQEVELVEHYLRINANRRPGSLTWDLKVMPYVQAERVAIPPMLIQPIVENAIEHGINGTGKGHIQVLVDRAGSVLHIEVRDNGVGRFAATQRPTRRNGNSMGMDLVRKRIALFDKEIPLVDAVEVRDERGPGGSPEGTTVILRMRIQHLNEHAAIGDRG